MQNELRYYKYSKRKAREGKDSVPTVPCLGVKDNGEFGTVEDSSTSSNERAEKSREPNVAFILRDQQK